MIRLNHGYLGIAFISRATTYNVDNMNDGKFHKIIDKISQPNKFHILFC